MRKPCSSCYLTTATASLLTLILAQAFQLGRGFHYTLPSDYKQHDVPAVLDTIVNLFPHNIAIVLQLFLVVLTLLVSIGTVGVPGTATITATSLFAAAGLPIPFIAISQPISQIVDMGRTALNVAGAANTAVIVAQTEHQLDTDLYYGRKEYSDDLNDGEQFGQTSTQSLTETGPSQRTNITNDAKFDSANVSQQQSGFTLNFAPNAVLSASRDDACCGTKPNK